MNKLADDTTTLNAWEASCGPERESTAEPETGYKPRDRHTGQPSPHLGQTHFEMDQLRRVARKIDEGPSFGTPGEPPAPNPDSLTEIEQAFEDLGREKAVVRSG